MASILEIPYLKVGQWLPGWENVKFDKDDNRKKPNPYFLLFSIKASDLKKLSKVYPRRNNDTSDPGLGIQRKHDPERSDEITKYLKLGYPLSDYSKKGKISPDLKDLQMPGWLPTAIVANILSQGDTRSGVKIEDRDLIKVEEQKIILPEGLNKANWNPVIPPIEIIDGQHRLWAFDHNDKSNDIDLPVVAFYDLDITWQAYLFYTINVKPKKINRSLAYDLYPLLRTQEWLERSPDTAFIYKEIRSQEIVEVLWSYEKSPWKDNINMIGDTQKTIESGKEVPNITQAAFIRNLIATFVRTSLTNQLGGLFGSKLPDEYRTPLSWNRTQQASFIIYIWQKMLNEIKTCEEVWAKSLRNPRTQLSFSKNNKDLAFYSKYSMITSDQGVRGYLHIINDFVFTNAQSLGIRNISWKINGEELKEDTIQAEDITKTIKDFEKSTLDNYISELCKELVKFDWRISSEPTLTEDQRRNQMLFKGSGGYKELRTQLIKILSNSESSEIKRIAKNLLK